MRVKGRFGWFTPKPAQVPFYSRRAAAQGRARRAAAAALAAWLEKHSTCANGCGRPVAFYDTVHYCLLFDGCCSAECLAVLSSKAP